VEVSDILADAFFDTCIDFVLRKRDIFASAFKQPIHKAEVASIETDLICERLAQYRARLERFLDRTWVHSFGAGHHSVGFGFTDPRESFQLSEHSVTQPPAR
jgi:hypothetical protein